jgi:hypothetical protein
MKKKTQLSLQYCDMTCPEADFPQSADVDGAGSCMTFAAVWCRRLREYTTKNAQCRLKSVNTSPGPRGLSLDTL